MVRQLVVDAASRREHEELLMHCQFRLGSRERHLRLTQRDGSVAINGQCRTHYAKQLAQRLVGEETGPTIVANDIEVNCSETASRESWMLT